MPMLKRRGTTREQMKQWEMAPRWQVRLIFFLPIILPIILPMWRALEFSPAAVSRAAEPNGASLARVDRVLVPERLVRPRRGVATGDRLGIGH